MSRTAALIAASTCLVAGLAAVWGMSPTSQPTRVESPQSNQAAIPMEPEAGGSNTKSIAGEAEEPAGKPNTIELPSSSISLSKEERQAAQEMQIAPLQAEAEVKQDAQGASQGEATPIPQDTGGSLNGADCKWKKTMLSTAYGPPWNSVEGGPITATGKALVPNRYYIATDPSVIPTGSKVKVWPNPLNYRGVFSAEDTGGAIKGKHIDIFVWQGKQVRDNWKKDVEVCLLK